MEDGIYRYRFSSPSSAGQLQSYKLQLRYQRQHLTPDLLKNEFGLHRFRHNRIPTALVSTTKDIVRAMKGAYDEYYTGHDIKDIYLTIINIPGPDSEQLDPDLRVHSAVQLAREIGLDAESQMLFKDEYLFEWEIPRRYVVHVVSLQTLYNRGFAMESYMVPDERGTNELRKRINKADTARTFLMPCFKCAIHICADGRDLRLEPEVHVQEGHWNPWMLKKLGRDCGQYYRWETACLNKVHVDREPCLQVRIFIMVASKRHITEVYDLRIDELRSKLQQAVSNNDRHLITFIREEQEEWKTWRDDEIKYINQRHAKFVDRQ